MAEQIFTTFKPVIGQPGKISTVELVPSSGGVYEVTVGDTLVYSKKQTGRHAEPGEVLEAIGRLIGGPERSSG